MAMSISTSISRKPVYYPAKTRLSSTITDCFLEFSACRALDVLQTRCNHKTERKEDTYVAGHNEFRHGHGRP